MNPISTGHQQTTTNINICMITEKISRLTGLCFASVHNNTKLFTRHYICLNAHSEEWSKIASLICRPDSLS